MENLPPGSPAPLCPMPLGRVPLPQAAPLQEGWVVDGATCLTWGAMRPGPSPGWLPCLWLVSPSSLFVPFFSDLLAFGPEDFLISCWGSIFAKRELAPETQGGWLHAWASSGAPEWLQEPLWGRLCPLSTGQGTRDVECPLQQSHNLSDTKRESRC